MKVLLCLLAFLAVAMSSPIIQQINDYIQNNYPNIQTVADCVETCEAELPALAQYCTVGCEWYFKHRD
ncbi:hypothetical protein ACF0H5_018544 [Mactra antiquata]